MFCYLSKNLTKFSLENIGFEINRDHSSVVHSSKKIDSEKDFYLDVKTQIKNITFKINQIEDDLEHYLRVMNIECEYEVVN